MPETRNVRGPRSVALVGPYSSGKSCLFEAMLDAAGAPVKRPADPRNRPATTEIRVGHCSYLGDEWSVLDCPGSIEFAFETNAALAMADIAVVVCEPNPAKAAAVAPVMKYLRDEGIPYLLFINKIDTLDGNLAETLSALQAHAGAPLVLRQMPIFENNVVSGYVDLMSERAYHYRKGQPSELMQIPESMLREEQEARGRLLETLADHDDALLEKLLEDIKPTPEEIYTDMHKDVVAGALIEVLLGCAESAGGVRRLWKTLRHDAPDPSETAQLRKSVDANGAALAQVFKTAYVGHTGKLSYARVWSGTITDGMTLNGNRLGGINRFVNGELTKVPDAKAGDVVALGRLESVPTGATLSPHGNADKLPFPEPAPPVYALAIATTDRKDDVKLSAALHKLAEEDPSLFITQDAETILHGQGEMHLQATVAHLARGYALKVATHKPSVAFKETIKKPVHEHGRLKRQTGGHGQFADVKIEVAPRARGEGFRFIDKVVGGAVPRNFIPAVGEAAEEATQKGPFGYPVVDLSVTLVDGGFHSVDSSDMAFRTATQIAMKEALAKAEPVLLEPIDHVTVSVPNEYTARAQRLLTGRRGQILGFAEREGWEGWDDVEALVPEAEMHDLIIELRSQTMGLGTFRKRFDHLAETKLAP